MHRESDFVHYELPNKHNRVGRIIKYITSNQTRMIYSITHIQGSASQRDDFETAANLLLLTAPNNSDTLKQSYRIIVFNNKKEIKYKKRVKYCVGDMGV